MNNVNPVSLVVILILVSFLCYRMVKIERFILSTIQFKNTFDWKLKKSLFFLGLLFLMAALIEWRSVGKNDVSIKSAKGDVFFALDYTSSMRVQDGDGGDRISFAINKILASMDSLDAHRIGLVIFSDTQYQLIPLTTDREFFRQHLLSLQENVKPDGGGYIESAFKEVEARSDYENETSLIVFSDFENVGLSKRLVKKYSKKFNLIAFKVGTDAGGRVPKLNQMKFGKTRYLAKNGREVFSYFNKQDYELFEYRADNIESLVGIFQTISKKFTKKQQSGWVPSTQKSFGSIFVFIGLTLYFISRGILWMSRYFAISMVFAIAPGLVSANSSNEEITALKDANDQYYVKVISGNGTHLDFINYANSFINEKKYKVALNLYKEQRHYLDKYNKINFGTLLFLNKDLEAGFNHYLNYLEKNRDYSSKENEIIRNNLIILFNQKSGSSGKSKNESKQKSGSEGEGKGKGNPTSGKNKRKSKMKGLSNEDILSKIKSDDMVNQGEYIKKKIKNKNINEVRW